MNDSSDNEECILKALGPFRILSSDDSYEGVMKTNSVNIPNTVIFGKKVIYGQTQTVPNK